MRRNSVSLLQLDQRPRATSSLPSTLPGIDATYSPPICQASGSLDSYFGDEYAGVKAIFENATATTLDFDQLEATSWAAASPALPRVRLSGLENYRLFTR